MRNQIIFAAVLLSCSSCAKKPFMCCLQDKGVFCTPEVPTDQVGVGEGKVCAVSTDIFKAQKAAQEAGTGNKTP